MNRKYVLKRRAERQDETRRRILEATVELHRTLGPAETSFTAVAELAGVQRHTVYSHFPSQVELFKACATHFLSEHPPPDLNAWLDVTDARQRLRRGLRELFAYYEANEEMVSRVLRDSEKVPVGGGFKRLQAMAVEALSPGWQGNKARQSRLVSGLRLATTFASWRTLVRESGLTSNDAAALMAALVSCVAAGDRGRLEPASRCGH